MGLYSRLRPSDCYSIIDPLYYNWDFDRGKRALELVIFNIIIRKTASNNNCFQVRQCMRYRGKPLHLANLSCGYFVGKTPHTAQASPQKHIDGLKLVAKDASDARALVASVTFANAPIKAPEVPPSLNTVTGDLAYASHQVPNESTVPKEKQSQICTEFKIVGDDLQRLLATLQGKHDTLKGVGFAGPIQTALRNMEGVFETTSLQIVRVVPECEADAHKVTTAVDNALSATLSQYSS
ncbi:hypothetical protein VHEMI09047 [[Torrubiella] hemipterigena]|uniref:Uncharacterized protein n=1 Tax=[Torrubiella] hemipterigena TaxID=1531966 RepID=A0A0A1T8L8_9HYPO|nr:hypothetical protein VHEMI09047 [[Torrubiella] hemipterigena]